jgi:hypothetical protein
VTSSLMGRIASPYFATGSSSVARSRAVAATLSPRSRAAIAYSRPKPRDVPVINHVFVECLQRPSAALARNTCANLVPGAAY